MNDVELRAYLGLQVELFLIQICDGRIHRSNIFDLLIEGLTERSLFLLALLAQIANHQLLLI